MRTLRVIHGRTRVAVSVAATAAIAAGLAGCAGSTGAASSGGGSTKNQTVTVFIRQEAKPTAATNAYYANLSKEFAKEHPTDKLEFDFWTSVDEETTKIETSAASHSGPDIFALGSAVMPTAWATGAVKTFTKADWNAVGGQAQFLPHQLTLAGPSPSQYSGVPDRNTAFGILYNKSMLKAAGITTPPTTWTEFVADARKLTNPAKGVYGVTIDPGDNFDPWHVLWLLSSQAGAQLVSKDGTKGQLNSPVVERQAAFWLDLISKYKVAARSDATNQFADSLAEFENGKAAMMFPVGTSAVASLNSSTMKNNYGIMQFPTIPYGDTTAPPGGVPAQSWLSQEYYTIFKYSPHTTLDLAAIKLLISDQSQAQVFADEGYLPSTTSATNAIPAIKQPPYDTLVKSVTESYATPFVGGWATLESVVAKALNQTAQQIASTGGFSTGALDQALTAANTQLTSALQAEGSGSQ
jgi:multiple sugar transport system substrate-binding protein